MALRRVVAFGGGTGLSCLLRGLVAIETVDVTAVVAVSDDGRSTGRLRRQLGIPAVGDARACLSALAGEPWASWLEHRFDRGDLEGHAAGNVLLAAAVEHHGSFSDALMSASARMARRGRVLPATDVPSWLAVEREDGDVRRGQAGLDQEPGRIRRVMLAPTNAPPAPGVIESLMDADLVVYGPGSFFSSVLASVLPIAPMNLLRELRARRVFVKNLAGQRGETTGMTLADQLRVFEEHAGTGTIDLVLTDQDDPDGASLQSIESRSAPVSSGDRVTHDPRLLADALLSIG